jgi:hypothetical protein
MLRVKFDDQALQFDDDRMLNTEAIALKKVTGLTLDQIIDGLNSRDPEAQTAMVWLARRRHGETDLRLSQVEFDVRTFDIDLVDDDGRVYWIRKSDGERVYEDGEDAGPADPTTPPAPSSAGSEPS